MKKLFFSLVATILVTTSVFASNGNDKINIEKSKKVETVKNEDVSQTNGRFWGREEIYPSLLTDCTPTGHGDAQGNQMCSCTRHYTYYVFWIATDREETVTVNC